MYIRIYVHTSTVYLRGPSHWASPGRHFHTHSNIALTALPSSLRRKLLEHTSAYVNIRQHTSAYARCRCPLRSVES